MQQVEFGSARRLRVPIKSPLAPAIPAEFVDIAGWNADSAPAAARRHF